MDVHSAPPGRDATCSMPAHLEARLHRNRRWELQRQLHLLLSVPRATTSTGGAIELRLLRQDVPLVSRHREAAGGRSHRCGLPRARAAPPPVLPRLLSNRQEDRISIPHTDAETASTRSRDEPPREHASSRWPPREFPERRSQSHRCGCSFRWPHDRPSALLDVRRPLRARHDLPVPRRRVRASARELLCGWFLRRNRTLDAISTTAFDNGYFRSLVLGRGVLTSDDALRSDARTKDLVALFAKDQTAFFTAFKESMAKMGRISVLTGAMGQVRKQCWVRNSVDTAVTPQANPDFAPQSIKFCKPADCPTPPTCSGTQA